MQDHRATRRLAETLADASVSIMRDYLSTLGLSKDRLKKAESFLEANKKRQFEAAWEFLQSIPPLPVSPEESRTRAERLKFESTTRQAFFKWAKKFIRKPAGGGRPRTLSASAQTAVIGHVSYLLGQGEDKGTAFQAAGRRFNVSASTIRRCWIEYEQELRKQNKNVRPLTEVSRSAQR